MAAQGRASRLATRVGGGLLIFTGMGHSSWELFRPDDAETRARLATMQSWEVPMPGVTRTIAELMTGFSWAMGLLLLGAGALVLAGGRERGVRWVAMVLSAAMCGLSVRHFFFAPVTTTALATLCFAASLWLPEGAPVTSGR